MHAESPAPKARGHLIRGIHKKGHERHGLSQPLHPSRGDLEQPPDQRQCRDCHLPLEGLPDQE
ncbi:hypothetical protein BQ8794_110149 [Mesorhizobium prunaredense]|uniref:Uncharacterized protein n=1 Tax=Mesorhizobium prunaredense TaxID=1631249 RepID=A0A1R3V4M9_9HYPH|nr:hypothetical protein BQ8794_110149 [Mesorhizobium prunaredense]